MKEGQTEYNRIGILITGKPEYILTHITGFRKI